MRRVRVLEVFFLLLPLLTASPANAVSEADRLWLVGTHAFEDRLYALAEKMLDRFVQHHQKDPRAPDAVLLLGKTRLALGSFERAIEDFRRAQRFPTPPGQPREAQFWEGETLFQLKRYPEARATYETVVRTPSSPLAPDAYYGLGWVALQQTQPEAAVRAFRQLLVGWPTHRLAPSAAYYLARTLADLKRPDEVRSALAGYETTYPDSPWLAEVLYLRGWSQLSTGQFEVATNTLQSFLARAPTHELAPQAQLQLAEALLRQGKKAEGLQQLQLLLTASPTTTPELLYDIGQLSQRFDFPAEAQQAWHRLRADFARHPLAFRASLESARTAFLQELYPDALAAATTAAASADLQLRLHAYLLIGDSQLQLKRHREAQAAYETVVRTPSSPLAPDAYYGLGWAALQQTQREAAVRAFRQLLAGWPTHRLASSAAYYLARTLADLKHPDEVGSALAGYETAYPDSPWLAEVLYLRGWSQLSTGQFEVATNTLQSFLARAPTHELTPQAQLQLAEALLRQGKKAEGLQQLRTLLTASPRTPELLYDIGQLSQRLDFPAEAQQAWGQLQTQFPTHPLARRASLELARGAFAQQRYADAVAAATTAAASDDREIRLQAYLLVGDSQLRLERYTAALRAFRTVTEESPRDHPLRLRALAGRALAHEHLEQWGDAVRIYQLVTSGSDEVLKKWARERLQAINARRKPADSSKTPGRANKLPVPNPRH